MLRQVFPFFLERGLLAIPFIPRNHRWVDLSSMVLMVHFLIVEGFACALKREWYSTFVYLSY